MKYVTSVVQKTQRKFNKVKRSYRGHNIRINCMFQPTILFKHQIKVEIDLIIAARDFYDLGEFYHIAKSS